MIDFPPLFLSSGKTKANRSDCCNSISFGIISKPNRTYEKLQNKSRDPSVSKRFLDPKLC
jgi:hypothetical protein